jgi:hypothetical protein
MLDGMARDPGHLSELLTTQRGVLTRPQALALGIPRHLIDSRLRTGRWRQLQLGVYATFSGEPSREASLWAAVLRAGPGAALSHRTAAELYGLAPAADPIHLTIPAERRVEPVSGLVVHRSRALDRMRHPVLLPPRTRVEDTLLDLATAADSLDDAVRWLSMGCGARLTTAGRLQSAADMRPRLQRRADLRSALADVGDGVHSVLEYRYVRDVERRHGLPRAVRQARSVVARRSQYRDNLYAEFAVCVELDGQAAHPDHRRWADQHRDNAAAGQGIITIRYSWADVRYQPCRTAAEVAAVLRRRGWDGSLRPCGPACAAVPRPRGQVCSAVPQRSQRGEPGFRLRQVGEGHAGVGEAGHVDRGAGPDQRLDVVVHVPDVDVHPGHHRAVIQPERDELQ